MTLMTSRLYNEPAGSISTVRHFTFYGTSLLHHDLIEYACYSSIGPRSPRPISASDFIFCVWNLDIGKMVHTVEGHELSVFGVAVTPDGRLAVSASADWLCWTIMPSHGSTVQCSANSQAAILPWRHQCFRWA